MKLTQIKAKMKSYRDLLGGDLVGFDDIDNAKTKEELRETTKQRIICLVIIENIRQTGKQRYDPQ